MSDKQMEDVAGDAYTGSGEDNTQLIPGKSLTGAGFVAGSVMADGSGSSNESAGSEVSPLQMELGKISKKCQVEGLAVIIISGISFSIAVTFALIVTIYFGPPQVPPHGAVVCEAKVCSDIGVKILKKGGSAVDAAVATAFCLGFVHPHATGLGSAGYMVVRFNKERKVEKQMKAYDFMGTVPTKPDENKVAVPGFLLGLQKAHEDYGKLKWEDLIQPTIDLANGQGLNVSKELAEALAGLPADMRDSLISKGPEMAELLETLKEKEGVRDFYTGILAQEIVSSVEGLTIENLNSYKVRSYKPIAINFRNVTVASCSAPCSGPLVLTALNILSNFTWSPNEKNSSLNLHRVIEALKYSYASRPKLDDPIQYPEVDDYVKRLLSKEFGLKVKSQILHNKTRTMEDYIRMMNGSLPSASMEPIAIEKDPPGASQIAVFGENEDQVSLTTSMGSLFGSKIKTSSGILLNNLLRAFNVAERENNGLLLSGQKSEAGIRPVTFLAPVVTFNPVKPCSRRVAIGVTGNLPGISALIQSLLEIMVNEEGPKEALTASQVHAQPETEKIWIKGKMDESIVNDLESQGHTVETSTGDFGKINIAAKIHETVQAVADPSGHGAPSIY